MNYPIVSDVKIIKLHNGKLLLLIQYSWSNNKKRMYSENMVDKDKNLRYIPLVKYPDVNNECEIVDLISCGKNIEFYIGKSHMQLNNSEKVLTNKRRCDILVNGLQMIFGVVD